MISIGIFFDGTGNNGINATSSQKPNKNNQSYQSDITNIYKLFRLFNGNEKKYIEGIGTVSGQEDSDFAIVTCKNPYGYTGYSSDDKLAEALDFINGKMEDQTKEYHFYIYGFSRGSMLARNLCNELNLSENVKVKFLGIFDTVESDPFNEYNVSILPEIENVLHICAVNECRYFFPLTGIFEESKQMEDAKSYVGTSVWKEIFVPGAHADIGGGYLEGSQSVYVSANYTNNKEVDEYVENVQNTAKDSEGNKIWNFLLEDYKIDEGAFFSQAYVERNTVYNDLAKVYGKLMLAETNVVEAIFSTDFNEFNFEINASEHSFLIHFSNELEAYTKDLSPSLKPVYHYQNFSDYTHISANFGLYPSVLFKQAEDQVNVEVINNGLNVPSNANVDKAETDYSKFHSDTQLLADGSIIDYAYGSNIPNNDTWSRSILIKENFYNKC